MKRTWLILGLIVAVTTLVAIQMYCLPDIYEAEAQIQIQQKQRSVLQTKDIVINSGYDPIYWNTQLRLLGNPQLARQVAITLDLPNNPAFLGGQSGGGIFASLRRIFAGRKTETTQEAGVPIAADEAQVGMENMTPEQLARLEPYEYAILGGLTVDPVDRTNLVNIRFKHTNPEIAMIVTNTLAEVFRVNDIRKETIGTERAAEMLARHIADL